MPKYKVNGRTFNIPDNEVDLFEADFPEAQLHYQTNDGRKFTIYANERKDFLSDFPDATELGWGETIKEQAKQADPFQPEDSLEQPMFGSMSYQDNIGKPEDSLYYPSPLNEEGRAEAEPITAEERSKQEYDMLMRQLSDFEAQNGEFMDTYEAYEKAAKHQVNEGGFALDTLEREYVNANSNDYHLRKQERDALNDRIKNNSYFNQMRMAEADAANETVDAISSLMAQNDAENKELHKRMQAMNALAMNPRGSFSGFAKTKEMQEYMDERADLETAKRLYENTAQVYAAPINDGEDVLKKFGQGFGQRLDDADFWSMGILGIADDMNARAAFQKIQDKFGSVKEFANLTDAEIDALLTPSEQLLISAVMDNNAAMYARKDNTAGAYEAGSGAADSLMFMAQFLLTGGIGDAATVGTAAHKRLVNWLGRKVGSMSNGLMKDVARGAVKLGVGTAESIGKALVMTPLMPHTYANIADKMMSFDDNGELMDTTDAIISGSIDALIETWSESTGDFVNKILGVPGDITKGVAKKVLKNVDFSDWGKAMNAPMMKILKKGGFNGFLGEMGEEFIGNATRSLVGTLAPGSGQDPEALKNFAQWEQLLVTAGSFAPMTIFGLGTSAAQYGFAKRKLANAQSAFESMLREASYTEDQTKFIIDELLGSTDAHLTPERLVANFSPLLRELAFNDRFANNRTQAMQSAVDFMWEIARYRTFDGVYHRQEEQQRNGMLAEIQEGTGREFWTTRLSENAGLDGTAYETDEVRAVEFNDGRVAYILGSDGTTNTVVYNDGQTGFLSEEQLNEGKTNGSIVSDATMGLNDYLTQQVARVRMTGEEQRMFAERDSNIGQIRAQFPIDATVELGTAEAPIQGVVRQQTPDGVIVESPAGISQLTWEELGHTIGVEVNPQTDAQMEEEAINNLEVADLQRRRAREQRRAQRNTAAEAALVEEQMLDEAENEGLEKPIPMKADGTVDQTALWNNDPERWAQWNDEQRQDGGANSLAYVSGAIAKEQAKIAELQAAYAAESDFDARDAVEKEIADTQARVERLTAIQQGYVAQAEAAAAPVVEAEPVAPRVASQMSEQEKAAMDAQHQARLDAARSTTAKREAMQNFINEISQGSVPMTLISMDEYEQVMKDAGCTPNQIAQVKAAIRNAKRRGQMIPAFFVPRVGIFAFVENIPNIEQLRLTYVHERQHQFTAGNKKYLNALLQLGLSRERLAEIVAALSNSHFYDQFDDTTLADEVISYAMERAYTYEDFSVALQELGVEQEIIDIITEIDNEQRFDNTTHPSRRRGRTNLHDNSSRQGDRAEDDRNSEAVSSGLLDKQRNRPLDDGSRRTGSTGEGAEVISEEQLNAPNSGEAQQITAADGEVLADTDGKGGVRFSIRTWNEGGRDYLAAWLANDTTLTEEEKADIIARMDEFYKNALLYSDTYAPFGTWSDAGVRYDNNGNPLMSVIKANGDYAMNLDFSLVCKKRRPLNRLLRTLVNRNAFATYTLRERELAEINWILQEHGFEVACALCFVDSKRYRVTGVADVFAALYNRLVKSLAPEGVQIAHFNYNENPNVEVVENGLDTMSDDQLNWDRFDRLLSAYKEGSVEHKVAQYLREHPEARKLVDATDFIEAEGFESVKENNPDLLKFYNMKKGTGGPKASFGDVQYLNDILKKERSFDAEKAYAVGGVRLQSFSDFVPHMYFDYMQLFAELAAKKLPLHAYTKEVLFAKIFGLTGAKINMSLVPAVVEGGIAPGLDAEGNYAWADPVTDAEGNVIQQGQSFPYDEAMAIQQAEGYSKNCGVIAVGISDTHIEKMLDDPNIPFIIPYHKSSLNAIVARMTNIDQYKDYTNVQNTRKASGSKLDKGTKDFNFNEYLHGLGESGTPQQAAQAYLDWCRENNYKPKFSQFAYHPNYYKLLQDFNTIDLATGEYAPQSAVTMTFPTEESAFGNVETLIQQGLQEDAELEEKMEQEIDGIADQVLSRLEEISKEPKMSEKQQARKMAELADERMAKIKERASGPVDIISEAEKAVDNELRMRVIGEVGARRMDDAVEATTMMDNLAVAKEMEEAGKDAKAIKMATGWERGADNLWRYEMEDFEFIGKPGRKKTFKLSDLIADHALFIAYPELKDIKVKYTKLAKGKGGEVATEKGETVIRINEDQYRAQNPVVLKAAEEFAKNHPEIAELVSRGRTYAMTAEQREIYLNELKKPFIENEPYINEFGGKGTLVHEIQHVIQDIENFAQGGNSAMVDTSDPAVRNEVETLQRVLGIEIENANELVPVLKDIFTRGRMAELSGDRQTALALKAEWNKKKAEWDNHSANINAIKKDLRKFRTLGLEGYRKLAGEVESRNAEARMNMSYNERRNSLLSETEDVAREDQIFLRDNVMMRGDEYMASQALVPGHKKGQPMLSDAEMMADVSFRITKNTKATIEKWFNKAGVDAEMTEATINYLDFAFEDTTEQLCAAKWYLNGKISLPDEDEYKVRDAVKVAKQNKVDALSYASPMDILNQFGAPKSKVKPINPDTVKEFSNKVEHPEGIVVYDVQDDFEGQAAVRKIIDTHWGEDANPWCLAARVNGDLDRAKEMWLHYSKYPKRIAFRNGKLLAFYASANDKTWWDRNDEPHTNIPYSVKSKEGEYEVSTNYELKEGNKKAKKVSVGKSDKKGRTAYYVGNRLESAGIQDGERNLFYSSYSMGATLSDSTYGVGRSIEIQYGPYKNVTQISFERRAKDEPTSYVRVGYGNNGVRAISFVEGARSWDIRYGINGDQIFVGGAQLSFDLTDELSNVYSGAYHMYRINDDEYEISRGIKKVGIVKKGEKVTMQMLEAFGEDGAPAGALLDFINDMGWNRADYPYPNPADADLLRRDDEVREQIRKVENEINEIAGGRYLSSVPAIRFRVTAEQDKAYMDAVKAGDMETAQRMVDKAAEAAGYTIRGDHGRVSKFSIFDRNKANPEGNWGQGFYFTNNEEDVENNYASVEGPDLEAKIEREVERRVNLAEMNEEFNEDGEVDEFAIREAVEDEFITSEPNVVHAAIKMDNPFVVGHGMVEIGEDGLGHYDMQETYLTAEYETDEDGEVDYSIDPTGTLVDLVEALNDELSEYEGVNINAYDILSYNIDGMTASQFEKEARELLENSADYLLNDDLAIMTSEIIRAAIERAGFDGIVDNTVNQKFGTARRFGRAMEGMDENTRHYIAFQSSQIKETDPVTYDDEGNVIPLSERFNPENADIRFRATEITQEVQDEMDAISATAIVMGNYLKAPNGADTNLTPEQWAMVRTKAFKAWFGNWEKAARIQKLRNSEDASIAGDEIAPAESIDKKAALEYGKKLQGFYTNKDTGASIQLQRGRKNGGVNEVLQHNYKDAEHLQSVAAIPQIIEKSIFIESVPNADIEKNPDVVEYQHFVCGLKIGGEDYTVHSLVAVDKKGDRYYDHNLTAIEKKKLLDLIESQAVEGEDFGTTPGTQPTILSTYKGKQLVSLLQVDASKVVDANGEPLVIWRGMSWDIMAEPEGEAVMNDSSYFSNKAYVSRKFGDYAYPYFMNARNPYIMNAGASDWANIPIEYAEGLEVEPYDEEYPDETGIGDIAIAAFEKGYDAVWVQDVGDMGGIADQLLNRKSNQIKAADNNTGEFSEKNDDIRFRVTADGNKKETANFVGSMDSKGNALTQAQQDFFANSKAVDKDGNLLVLYHGTPRAGFTEFKSGWFTTSKEDAISYSGDRKGRLFDPNEKYEPETLVAGDFPLGYMTFDSEGDRDAFLDRFPYANEVMSEGDYESARLGADEEYDALTARRDEFAEVWNAYREYERERFVDTTIGDLIANPEAYTEDDLRRAMLAYDSNANFDSLDDMDATERKDALVSALQNANEEAEGGILDMVVATRVPRNGEGRKHNDLGNRTYEVYANIENPYEIDANGRGSEFESGDIYKAVEEALADEQYDGVIVRNWRVGRTQQLGDVVVPKNGSQIKLTSNENPSSSSDIRFRTSLELDEEFGDAWRNQQNEDGRHSTQVANTKSTYEKIGRYLEDAGMKGASILDASSGLGLGTQALREMGFQVDDVEPFPSENREAPTFSSYADIDGKYDVVISNAVLNVIPDDWRADVLHQMADAVKEGGKMIINTRPASNIAQQGVEGKTRITLDSPSEILVKRGDRIAAYQKGFTSEELAEWIKSELGEGWRVEKATKKNSGISGEGTAVVIKESDDTRFRTTGTPTDELVTNGLQLTPAQTAEVAANIFAALPEESRKKITDSLNGNVLGLKDAILQIPTSLASKENWNEEDRQMAAVVAEEMTKMAGEMTRPFSVEEGLWLLYNNLNKGTDLVSQASRALVQRNLGFDAETLARQEQAKEGVRFRTVGDATSNAQASLYNRGAVNVWTRLKESYVDMMASVEELVKAIEKRSGKVAQGFENILLALNQQSSKGLAAMESYTHKFLNPMFDEIRRIMDETKMKYEDIVRYVILKHGLERNKKLAQRDARAHYQEIYDDIISKITGMTAAQKRTYLTNAQLKEADAKAELATLKAVDMSAMTDEEKREHKKKLTAARKAVEEAEEHLRRAQKIASLSEQEAQDELDKIFEKIENGTDSVFKEMRENDYSGISSMFYDQLGVDRKNFSTEEQYQAALMDAKKDKYSSLADVEAAAEAEVASFEGKVDTKELWKRINAATKETLRQQYEANIISKDQYLNLRDMFEYYVPLRGFKDNTAEDMYTYYRKPNSTGYTKPILGAEGRKTEAESPFGWIAAMAGSAIASNVKNEAKLALYYFVSNRPENGIATISKTWFVDSGEVDERGKKIFKPAYPPFSEDLSSAEGKAQYEIWQANMKELQKKGQAYEAGQRLNLGNAVVNISDANKPEHIVNVKVGGKDYTIIINGNPRAAQAINGDLNIEGTAQDYGALFGPVLRWMSSVNTSYNPEFWITNMMRDMAFTMMAVNIKEDPAYRRKFSKNYRKAFKVISLVAKNEKGTIGDSYLEEQYKDFVKYGGVTGYTQIKDSETWEQEIENYLSSNDPESIKSGKVMRGMKTAFHAAHRFGESLEQVSRFAAFLTARETGKSINEAINDAKEITVNFNRKGSGKMITLEEAKYLTGKNGQPLTKFQQWMAVGASSIAPLGRRFIMFFNAAIQGLNATYKLMKKNPKRFTGWALGYAAVGMMNAVLHAMLDDDDDYLDIPQYERRNSLMIGGKGAYFKWALPQEARAFYALGDLAVETVMGRNPHQNFLGEALKIGTEILPVNPSEGWKAFMPSVAIPFIELALNEDYKGAPIYNEQKWLSEEEKERTAKWSNAYQGTGWTYVKIAQGLNFITGGDKHDAGWINLQPEKLEHLVQSAFGGTIRTADKFINTISAALDPEEPMTIRQTPFLNRFLTINDERFKNVHVNDVFDYYKADAEHALTLEKQYIKDRDMDSLTELRSSDEYQWAKIYGKYKESLKAIQDKIKVADGTAEKKELMKQQDELKKRMIKEISEL